MLPSDLRRRRILDRMARTGSVRVRPLARTLRVAEMTVRRDLEALEREGLLRRTHGGAVAAQRVTCEFSFREKEKKCRAEKARIAAACARMVRPDDTVFLDSGSTALEIARALLHAPPALILTHNLCVVSVFLYQSSTRILVPGGELNPLAPDLFGELTLHNLDGIRVDLAFLGADAVDPADGFFAPDLKSAAISAVIARNARRCVLAVDSSKFGRRSTFRAGSLDSLSDVVTDRGLAPPLRKKIRSLGVRLVLV
ncbi:MAG: DeoR/GlpR family DNA-binding transcription regulator [Planctomycetota bacterium]